MLKGKKEELVKEFSGIFSQAAAGVLVDFQGFTVEEVTNLRKNLFASGSRMKVLKNTLARRAVQGTPFEGLSEYFVQTRAIVYHNDDMVAPAKVIAKEAKANEKLGLIAGALVSSGVGEVLDEKGVEALGSLPSREELIAKLLFVLNAPITNFVRALNEIPASLVRVLQAVADSKDS